MPSPGSRAAAACAARAPAPNRIHPWPLRAVPHCSERRRRGSRSPLLAACRSAGRGRCRRPRTCGSVGARTRARALPRASRSGATVQTHGLSPDREWGSHSALTSTAIHRHQRPLPISAHQRPSAASSMGRGLCKKRCNPIQSAIPSNPMLEGSSQSSSQSSSPGHCFASRQRRLRPSIASRAEASRSRACRWPWGRAEAGSRSQKASSCAAPSTSARVGAARSSRTLGGRKLR